MARTSHVNAKKNESKMIEKLLFSRKNQLITGLVVFLLLANPVNIAIILSEADTNPFNSIISIQERNRNDPNLQNLKIVEGNAATTLATENTNSIEDDNLSWTLISDGLGFENAIRQEFPKFDNFESQEEFFKDYTYPDLYTYNASFNVARDTENQILWFSFRPTIKYGNRDTWPLGVGNPEYWPTVENNTVSFPDDPENIGYYLSEPMQISFMLTIVNGYFTKFHFYPDPNICPKTTWENQWQPCEYEYLADNTFPLVLDEKKSENQLTEGMTNRSEPGLMPMFNLTNTHSYDDIILDDGQICNYWDHSCEDEYRPISNLYNGPKMQKAFVNLLAFRDYDNFGISYEIEKHLSSVAIVMWKTPLVTIQNPIHKLELPEEFFKEREGVPFLITPFMDELHRTHVSTGEAYVGPTGKTLYEVHLESNWDLWYRAIDLTVQNKIKPVIANDPYVPEINVYPPQISYKPSISLAIITTTAASTVALSATTVFLNRKETENINRNPVKYKDKKRRSRIISSAISENIIRRN